MSFHLISYLLLIESVEELIESVKIIFKGYFISKN